MGMFSRKPRGSRFRPFTGRPLPDSSEARIVLFVPAPEPAVAASAYTLARLAPGSYDVILDGEVVASLVRSGPSRDATWTAELLQDLPPRKRPAPFVDLEHSFSSLEEARAWLGGPTVEEPGL